MPTYEPEIVRVEHAPRPVSAALDVAGPVTLLTANITV